MKTDLPQKISCSVAAEGIGVKDILIEARFEVSCKNPYAIIIGPTDKEGHAEITRQQIIEETNKQMNVALMDYKSIEEVFTGVVIVNIMDKKELCRAIDAYELFKAGYSYRSNYKEDLNQAIKKLNEIEKDILKLNASIEPSELRLVVGKFGGSKNSRHLRD